MVKKRKIDGWGEADGLEKAGKKQRVCSGVVRKRKIDGGGLVKAGKKQVIVKKKQFFIESMRID